MGPHLPQWIVTVSGWLSLAATLIILGCIVLHLRNYRKPFQQRLMIRIQLIVPLFALSCYLMLVNPEAFVNKFVIEPVREIYEAFVIYTFFSLLTDMLGGERNIIIFTSGREPVPHPGIVHYVLPDIDISDPYTFLYIKRGILQYVWFKPLLCFGMLLAEGFGWYDVNDMGPTSVYLWLMLFYNFSVTLSLYCLAIFWKVLWTDLKPFRPVGKFLCVKLIIFASYWQGVLLAILNFAGVLPGASQEEAQSNIGLAIQNALLCVELIAFAIGHWVSFSYRPYVLRNLPTGRVQFYYALKDMFGVRDLVNDFRITYYGDYYKDYKQFDSVEALIAHPDSKGRMSRINQGLRYHLDGRSKHWLPTQPAPNTLSEYTVSTLPLQPSALLYAPSLKLVSTSTKALYPNSPKISPAASPTLSSEQSIAEVLAKDSDINYDAEMLDQDEAFYHAACSVVNNYRLDQQEVKRLLNYPIVDEMVGGHVFGYKVKKLREDRLSRMGEPIRRASVETNRYGSIV